MAYERIQFVGNIGRIDMRESKAGHKFCSMSVAVNRDRTKNTVVWYNVLFYGPLCNEEYISRYKQGNMILVEGRPEHTIYVRGDGSPAISHDVIAMGLPERLSV